MVMKRLIITKTIVVMMTRNYSIATESNVMGGIKQNYLKSKKNEFECMYNAAAFIHGRLRY